MAGDVMVCPRAHQDVRIVRDGIQRAGGRSKQRWRCTRQDGSFHRFLGVVSRTRATDDTCTECENHIAPHEGPAAPAEFEYLIREIANALIEVGHGATYTDAAKRVRMRANIGKTSGVKGVSKGQTVADWMTDFVPIVAAPYQEAEWPAVLVLDSINFRWTDKGGKNHMLYSVLAAYGYDELGKNGRLVKVDAGPSGGTDGWTDFLRSKPGRPVSIVADQDEAIRRGIVNTWGADAANELLHHCEHHLRSNAIAAMDRDKLLSRDEIPRLFKDALLTEAGWDAFEAAVLEQPKLLNICKWVLRWGPRLRAQAGRRDSRPPVYANGAVEAALAQVRNLMEPRMYSYKNRARTNRMLELVRLSMLRADDAAAYTAAIRAGLVSHDGHLQRGYRDVYDKTSTVPFESKHSLWSTATQRTMAETKRRRAEYRVMMAARMAEAGLPVLRVLCLRLVNGE
jgi:hypothetical protein